MVYCTVVANDTRVYVKDNFEYCECLYYCVFKANNNNNRYIVFPYSPFGIGIKFLLIFLSF